MSQFTLYTAPAGDRAAAPAGPFRFLPWVFVCLGVLAPLMLVIAAAMGTESSVIRAQMIVQGGELLAIALLFTIVLSLLYALGVREAVFVTAQTPRALQDISAA